MWCLFSDSFFSSQKTTGCVAVGSDDLPHLPPVAVGSDDSYGIQQDGLVEVLKAKKAPTRLK